MRITNIYNQDCLEGMKDFPDKYFDAIVTDPPDGDYGWIKEAQRVSKRMFVFLGYWNLQKYLKEIDDYRDLIILYSTVYKLRNIIPVVVSGDHPPTQNHIPFVVDNKEVKHPCPIPLDAVRQLLINYLEKGDRVCDPFIGSGTTGIACNLEGVEWIGFENNETHYKEAVKRIDSYQYIRT